MEIQDYFLASQRFNSVLLDLEDLITVRTMPVEKQADLRGHFKSRSTFGTVTQALIG